ncbi:hypothetical protein GCM10009609_70360 [Pseudonocardia aurantiaca]
MALALGHLGPPPTAAPLTDREIASRDASAASGGFMPLRRARRQNPSAAYFGISRPRGRGRGSGMGNR